MISIGDDYVRSFLFDIPLSLHVSLTVNNVQSYFVKHYNGSKVQIV